MSNELSIATFNVRNLQGAGAARYRNSTPYSEAFYSKKVRWTGEMIRQLGADIVGFQEVWSSNALVDALDRVNLDDDYQLAAPAPGDIRAIHNALAIKQPHQLLDFEYVEDLPPELSLEKAANNTGDRDGGIEVSVRTEKFSRPLLVARVQPMAESGRELPVVRVVVGHLKSKRPMELGPEVLGTPGIIAPDKSAIGSALSMIKRTTEAAGVRIIVSRLQRDDPDDNGPGRPVIVLGDLNSSQHSVPLSILSTQPTYRLEQGSRVGRSSKWGLYSVATLQELRSLRDVYFTYIHQGFRDSLDHILLSQEFYDYSAHRVWSFRESTIFNDHLSHAKDGPDHEVHVSDHGAVRAVFEHNPAD